MIKTICFFTNCPLDDYYAEIYGAHFFQSMGLDVVVCNLTKLITPDYRPQHEPRDLTVAREVVISSSEDLIRFFQETEGMFGIVFFTLQLSTLPIYRALTIFDIPYLNLYTNNLPTPSLANRMNDNREWQRITLNSAFRGACGRIQRWYLRYLTKLKSPNYLFRFGKKFTLNCPAPDARTRVINCHTFDYDLAMEARGIAGLSAEPFAVFLDEYFVGHHDFAMQNQPPPVRDTGKYFSALRDFFDSIERVTTHRVLIAAHPRSNYEPGERCFGQRTIVRARTASLVKQSKFVITHSSTSVSFAVIYRKPIVFLTSDELERSPVGRLSNTFANTFRQVAVNIDHLDKSFQFSPIITEPIYKEYEENYVKYPGSSNENVWKILCDQMVKDRLI